MKSKIGCLFWFFLFCWFIGAIVVSNGLGSFFPSINLVSRPLVCPHGKMEPQRHVYRPYPGTTIINVTWSCTDESSGAKTALGDFLVTLISGAFYGALLFALALIVWTSLVKGPSGDSQARMQELDRLYAAKLISETEYEEKANEILKNI